MEHLIDGILFGLGFALVNVPIEFLARKFTNKRSRVKKAPILKLIKNSK